LATDHAINAEAVQVYRLRVVHPAEPLDRLAVRAGLAAEQVAAAERELVALGLLRRSTSGGWVAVAPDGAAEQLLAHAELEIARQLVAVTATRAQLQALSVHYLEARSMSSAKGAIEHVQGVDNVWALIEELARTSTSSLRALVPYGPRNAEATRVALPLDFSMLSRGVELRYLCGDFHNQPPFVDYARVLTRAGGQFRILSALPTRMLLYDGASALLPADPALPGSSAVLVRDPVVLRFVVSLFDHMWDEAARFNPDSGSAALAPTGAELAVLHRIADGKTNEAIARELGISPRTVTRQVADLMRRLGTGSRFQAGVRAVQLGWLDKPVS
jgi:DNA-binding CsgD family transcriptional regulator